MTQASLQEAVRLADALAKLPGAFRKHVRVDADGCWTWTGTLNQHGYGITSARRVNGGPSKWARVHGVAFETLVRPVTKGLCLDHLCRNRACFNPAHLEEVTGRENTLRGVGPTAKNAVKTQCKYGHPFTAENLVPDKNGWRQCRACQQKRGREFKREKRAKAALLRASSAGQP